jgi:hypothetical protein
MANTQRHFQVVNGLPANIPGVLGGHDPELLRALGAYIPQFPPLDSASNFTRFIPPNATDTPENLFVPGFTRVSIPVPRFASANLPTKDLLRKRWVRKMHLSTFLDQNSANTLVRRIAKKSKNWASICLPRRSRSRNVQKHLLKKSGQIVK